jgi:hypothetical protein
MRAFELIAARAPRNFVRRRVGVIGALAVACLLSTALDAFAQRCQPRRPRPTIMLTTLGPCEYNPETFSFAGTPDQQAMCLMRSGDRSDA